MNVGYHTPTRRTGIACRAHVAKSAFTSLRISAAPKRGGRQDAAWNGGPLGSESTAGADTHPNTDSATVATKTVQQKSTVAD